MEQLLISEEVYKRSTVAFPKELIPKYVLQTSFVLPFYVGMPDTTTIGGFSVISNHGFIFAFKRIDEKISYDKKGLILTNLSDEETVLWRTYVEAVSIREAEIMPADGDGIISDLLWDLNTLRTDYSGWKQKYGRLQIKC